MIKNIETPSGNIYAVSDIHGKYNLFMQLLEHLNFNKETDIMLSVGDLIDRGEDSLKCARLIYEPWFHATQSNHGDMFYHAMKNKNTWQAESFIHNGGDWILPIIGDDELLGLAEDMGKLPYVINIRNKQNELFHIIHAELSDERLTGNHLQDEHYMTEYFNKQLDRQFVEMPILWSRNQFGDFYGSEFNHSQIVNMIKTRPGGAKSIINLQNPDRGHIISGHTVLQQPITILNQTCIDTGSFVNRSWAGITCVNLNTMKMVQSQTVGVREISAIVITEDDLND